MHSNQLTKNISFEFFPPQTTEHLDKLLETAQKLNSRSPAFFSVTYGAGGSTQERSLNTIQGLLTAKLTEVAPHISCIGSTKEKISELLAHYKSQGIRRLVALRGDLPSGLGTNTGHFRHAQELVAFIRENSQDHFHIEVAAYPECHPEASSMQVDLKHFKEKVTAGADSAITQYFYNVEAYEQFLNNCLKLNINIPIIPGIMPITNYTQLARFSDNCGAEIPRWIRKHLEDYGDNLDAIKDFGIEVITKLCEKLVTLGAPGLHFYTLNKADSSLAVLANLNLI